ncbi:MAG: peptide chain release factor N(5)-glutamine methyltransferase [Candidatus Latescibacterota bacterium]
MSEKTLRVVDLIITASKHLKSKGFENARLEVERMLGSVLGLNRIELYISFDRPVSETEVGRFRALYRRRLAHEPLQYVTGSTEFRELRIITDNRALIPRPETEILVSVAIEYLRGYEKPLVADLGTGTGVIALSVAKEIPGAKVVAVELSDDALQLADENIQALRLGNSVTLKKGDMLEGVVEFGLFDAILSNPPYISSGDIKTLQPEINVYEPRAALDGGSDGMRYLRTVAENAHRHLKSGGLLLLECGEEQADIIKKALEQVCHYRSIEIIKDMTGRERLVKAIRI